MQGALIFNFPIPELTSALPGIIALSLAIASLLVADEVQVKGHTRSGPKPGEETDVSNGHSISYGILTFCTQRTAFIALAFLLTLSGIWLIMSMISNLLKVEYSEATGLNVRIGGQTLHSLPISSIIGWQTTNIRLEKGELFDVEILGRVSPGYVQNLEGIQKYIKDIEEKREEISPLKILWPFLGPEGYEDKFYDEAKEGKIPGLQNLPHYEKDDELNVKGLPHNVVVGIVVPDGKKPENKYDWEADHSSSKPKLILLSPNPDLNEKYPITRRAPASGILWVVINDAEIFRIDNMGQFFMKVLVR